MAVSSAFFKNIIAQLDSETIHSLVHIENQMGGMTHPCGAPLLTPDSIALCPFIVYLQESYG